MADVFSRRKRSYIMSRVKGRGNRLTELRLIGVFRIHGLVGWRRNSRIFGRPDFIFREARVAVFVDGCFWHGCPRHGAVPATNIEFWTEKLARNRRRDRLVNRTLKALGWKPLRIWQHELREPAKVARRIERAMRTSRRPADS
jgi:DNA mismatch endonuclease (patch repair protein)